MSKKQNLQQLKIDSLKRCQKELSTLDYLDINQQDIQQIIKNAVDHINRYPGIENTKYQVLRTNDPDHFAGKISRILNECLKECVKLNLSQVNADLTKGILLISKEKKA